MTIRGALRPLFVNQGAASEVGAAGHVRATAAIHHGLSDRPDVEATFALVPPWSTTERMIKRRVGVLGEKDLGALRWQLARSRSTRRLLARTDLTHVDVIHIITHLSALLLADTARRLPLVLSADTSVTSWERTRRGLLPADPDPVDVRASRRLEARALRYAAATLAWTQTVAADLEAAHPGHDVRAHHPGIDTHHFSPGGTRRPGPHRVLFVGRRFVEKGGAVLVDALSHRLGYDLELHVATTATLERRAGLVMHSVSAGTSEQQSLFRDADLLVLPSRSDAVPWVVLEAMACGVPVVASPVGSIPEMLGNGSAGLIIEPTAEELRPAVDALLADLSRRTRMAEAGRGRCLEHYDARRQAHRLLDVLAEVADRHRLSAHSKIQHR